MPLQHSAFAVFLQSLTPLPSCDRPTPRAGAKVTDTGAAVIARQFRRLRSLEICGGALSDAGVAHLARLPTLRCLSVAQNRGVTDLSVPVRLRPRSSHAALAADAPVGAQRDSAESLLVIQFWKSQ